MDQEDRSSLDGFLNSVGFLHEKDDSLFKCKVCIGAGEKNVFVTGKSVKIPKKDDFQKHERSQSHINASTAVELQKQFAKKKLRAYDLAEQSLLAQLRTAYVQAKEGIPNSKHEKLIELQKLNEAPMFQNKNTKDTSNKYTHHSSVTEMHEAIAAVIQEDIEKEIGDSPYRVYGLEADEGTDVGNKSIVVIYVRYVANMGQVQTKYLSVEELPATRADDVRAGIEAAMKARNIVVENLVGLGTDGASIMRGVHTGVTTQFKKVNSTIIAIHCMAHRLQLACEKAAKKVPYIEKYIAALNRFARILKDSPKLCRALENCKIVTEEKANKIYQVFFTRWLSFEKSVNALVGCISSVISSLVACAVERSGESRAMLHGLYDTFAKAKFVLTTAFLADAMSVMGRLSKQLQVANVQYGTVMPQILAATEALEVLKSYPEKGPKIYEVAKGLENTTRVNRQCE